MPTVRGDGGDQGNGSGSRSPLLERDRELELLSSAAAAAAAGNGRLALLTGPPGIGKSRLLEEATERARGAGLQVLVSRCQALERDFSLGVPLRLYERAWRERGNRAQGAARLAKHLFEPADGVADAPADLFRLLHGLFWLTADVAEAQPLALVVDDAHWADPSSLRFLGYLARRIEDVPVALLLAARLGDAAGDRDPLLAELSVGADPLIRLDPLSSEATGVLVRDGIRGATQRFCDVCAETSGGNPFLLGELLAELRTEGISGADRDAERVQALAPAGIRRATLLRIGRLGSRTVDVAKAIAVLADDAEIRHVAELARVSPPEAAEAAEALVGAEILSRERALAFTHPLIARSVRLEIAAPIREQMHLRVARLLADEGAPAERVAAHLLQAARQADQSTVESLREAAGAALSRGSPASAVRYLGRALEEPAQAIRAEVTFELGQAEALTGSAKAVELLSDARRLGATPVDRARATHALARALYARGRIPEAADAFLDAALEAAGHDRELELQCEAEFLPAGLLVPSRVETVLERVPAALAKIGKWPRAGAERAILGVASLVSMMMGEPHSQALALAERALDRGRLLDEEGADGTTLYSVTGTLTTCGKHARCIELLTEAIERGRAEGSVMGFATASYCRSFPLLWSGAPTEAIADAEAAVEAGWEQYLPAAYAVWVSALVECDKLEDARRVAAQFDHQRWQEEPMYALLLQARARLSLASGDPKSALADAERAGELWQVPNPAFYSEWRSLAARSLARLGERERAVALAAEELELVRRFGAPRALGVALHALGVAQGGAPGIESLRDAVAALEGSEARLEHCRALVDAGAAVRRAGQRSESRELLRRGLVLAQRHGLAALERYASEELKLAGGRPRSRYLSGVESLTPAELRVARMAAEGMTNREIAQSLFVTIKAVQYHLGNTYRKLEIGGRAELAEALAANGVPAREKSGGGY